MKTGYAVSVDQTDEIGGETVTHQVIIFQSKSWMAIMDFCRAKWPNRRNVPSDARVYDIKTRRDMNPLSGIMNG